VLALSTVAYRHFNRRHSNLLLSTGLSFYFSRKAIWSEEKRMNLLCVHKREAHIEKERGALYNDITLF